jgi:lantibiotic transport system permease protein
MWTSLLVEYRKLKGSLIWLLALVAPSLVTVLVALITLRRPSMDWEFMFTGSTGLWAFFVLPMTVTAISALLAHIEHGPRAWDHLFALPIQRWRFFAAKAVILMGVVAIMTALLAVELYLVGAVFTALTPATAPQGEFPWPLAFRILGQMWATSLFMAMIQLWVALRFRSFVAPLTVGLGGTFVAVAAFNAKEAMYVPWAMPVSIVGYDGLNAIPALQLGVTGGVITLIAMIVHMSRREA